MPYMESQCDSAPYLGMDPKHRKLILNNINHLIDETEYDVLIKGCQQNGLLTQSMCNKIKAVSCGSDEEASRLERHRRLFEKLTKRGPDAYQKLIDLLDRLNYQRALLRLREDRDNENCISINERMIINYPAAVRPLPMRRTDTLLKNIPESKPNNDDELELKPYSEEIPPCQEYEVIKSKNIMNDKDLGVYSMKSQQNRGILFVVNIIEFVNKDDYRKGAKNDSESLLQLFKEFNFKMYKYDNLTHVQFFSLLNALLKSDDVKETECFVLVLMTHGCKKGSNTEIVEFTDGSHIDVGDIVKCFSNEKCKNLLDKPKILLFPFCRGEEQDLGNDRTQTDSIRTALPSYQMNAMYSDLCICYAAFPGFRSHRDPDSGSWYIQDFCKSMAEHAHNKHFEDILKIIQKKAIERRSEKGSMQSGNYLNYCFNKKLYFNPGVYE